MPPMGQDSAAVFPSKRSPAGVLLFRGVEVVAASHRPAPRGRGRRLPRLAALLEGDVWGDRRIAPGLLFALVRVAKPEQPGGGGQMNVTSPRSSTVACVASLSSTHDTWMCYFCDNESLTFDKILRPHLENPNNIPENWHR